MSEDGVHGDGDKWIRRCYGLRRVEKTAHEEGIDRHVDMANVDDIIIADTIDHEDYVGDVYGFTQMVGVSSEVLLVMVSVELLGKYLSNTPQPLNDLNINLINPPDERLILRVLLSKFLVYLTKIQALVGPS